MRLFGLVGGVVVISSLLGACTEGPGGSSGFNDGGTGPGSEGSSEAGVTSSSATVDAGGSSTETGDEGPKFDLSMETGGPDKPDESTCEAVAQSLSSAGCLFAPVIGRTLTSPPWAVVAANTNDQPANVTLTSKDGVELGAATVLPGELEVFELDAGSAELNAHRASSGTNLETRVMLLESDIPIVAYQFTPFAFSEVASADASLLLPEHVWDDDYYTALYSNDGSPWLQIVSLVDGNQVTVTAPPYFTGSTQAGAGLGALVAGQSGVVTLGAQDVLRISTDGAGTTDLTGFRVESTDKIAVMAGSTSMSIPGPTSKDFRDLLEEQVPPRAAWGKQYVAAKFRERGGEVDLYRFVADQDGTVIDLTGGYQGTLMLDAGEFGEVATSESFFAESDEPFMVEHLMVSQDQTTGPKDDTKWPGEGQSGNCWGGPSTTHVGDPAITFLAPVDQYRFDYTFLTPPTYAWDNMTVVAKQSEWDLIELDGAALPEPPTPIGQSGWAHASFAIDDGTHVVASDAKVGIEVYGYDCHISYAYPGGLNLVKLNPEG